MQKARANQGSGLLHFHSSVFSLALALTLRSRRLHPRARRAKKRVTSGSHRTARAARNVGRDRADGSSPHMADLEALTRIDPIAGAKSSVTSAPGQYRWRYTLPDKKVVRLGSDLTYCDWVVPE